MVGVTGSIPVAPTIKINDLAGSLAGSRKRGCGLRFRRASGGRDVVLAAHLCFERLLACREAVCPTTSKVHDKMLLRDLPSSFSQEIVADIDGRLAAVEAEHGVSIALAIESGSRAWGFPSPDSDYHCRFIFVRPIDQYLSPWQPRDVSRHRLTAIST
jgi:RNA repair pathway DNA polymerase beta family